MGFWDGSGISWPICKQSVLRSRHITTPTPHRLIFYRPGGHFFRWTSSWLHLGFHSSTFLTENTWRWVTHFSRPDGLPVTTERALLNSSWQRQICCVTRWKFSHGSRIHQSRLRPAAVASERYLRRGSTVSCGNSSSSSNSNSNSNCNSSLRCYLPSLQCLHNKQSNHSANYRSSDTSANSSAAKFLLIQLSPFWLFSLQNSNTFKILLPGLFKHTMTVPFPAVASALALATCLFPYQVQNSYFNLQSCHLKSTAKSHSSAQSSP